MPSIVVTPGIRNFGAAVAAWMASSKPMTAKAVCAGLATSFTVSSVMIPHVPSVPAKALAVSKPFSPSRWCSPYPETWRGNWPSSVRSTARWSLRSRSSCEVSAGSEVPPASRVTRRPSPSMTVTETRFSALVPHVTEWEPHALLATMPPTVQRECVEGSGP